MHTNATGEKTSSTFDDVSHRRPISNELINRSLVSHKFRPSFAAITAKTTGQHHGLMLAVHFDSSFSGYAPLMIAPASLIRTHCEKTDQLA
jgi:hypothetical protein